MEICHTIFTEALTVMILVLLGGCSSGGTMGTCQLTSAIVFNSDIGFGYPTHALTTPKHGGNDGDDDNHAGDVGADNDDKCISI